MKTNNKGIQTLPDKRGKIKNCNPERSFPCGKACLSIGSDILSQCKKSLEQKDKQKSIGLFQAIKSIFTKSPDTQKTEKSNSNEIKTNKSNTQEQSNKINKGKELLKTVVNAIQKNSAEDIHDKVSGSISKSIVSALPNIPIVNDIISIVAKDVTKNALVKINEKLGGSKTYTLKPESVKVVTTNKEILGNLLNVIKDSGIESIKSFKNKTKEEWAGYATEKGVQIGLNILVSSLTANPLFGYAANKINKQIGKKIGGFVTSKLNQLSKSKDSNQIADHYVMVDMLNKTIKQDNKMKQPDEQPILDKSEMDTIIFILKDNIKTVIEDNSNHKVTEIIEIGLDDNGDMKGQFNQDDKYYDFVFTNDTELTITLIDKPI